MRKLVSSIVLFVFLGLTVFITACSSDPERVLIFTKTHEEDGHRHESIEKGVEVLTALAMASGYEVEHTENDSLITERNLQRFKAVVFLSTSHDILDHYQQADFERFIQAGGGFLGIHGASTTEYDWPWYGGLVGAYFVNHPEVQTAKLRVTDLQHPSTDSIPEIWERSDEWYNFRDISDDLKVVLTIDESSYEGGENGESHPMAWYHDYDGGRSFYTALGHTSESYYEPLFRKHLNGALKYVMEGVPKLDYSKVSTLRPPAENRFTKIVLGDNLFEPTEMAIMRNGKVLFVERGGRIKQYSPITGDIKVINNLDVSMDHEDGLMGLSLDPDFETNHWVYMYYSKPGEEAKQHLSRFEYIGDSIDLASEVVILEVHTQREECCHTGGSITWDSFGNLYLSTGDNTNPFESDGYGPMDERPGRLPFDAQASSANPNDLRGKILRIHPESDGSYTIPEGNLFPEGIEGTRPEIYIMGNRNPYRISVDKRTGFLYWGEVGPDAGEDSLGRGPRGYDEINQARQAGNFGWPMFVGDNKAYNDYDFAKGESGTLFNPEAPMNTSPNNTGIQNLPPSQPAFIWYPYAVSVEFPMVGTGGRNAMAGPVYYSSDFSGSEYSLPDYFDGKLFIYDWMRGWIFAVTMNENGDFQSMEPFMAHTDFNNPIDMEMGPDGVLYVLEYGTSWYTQNQDARLVRIDYNGGNRPPVVKAESNITRGSIPFEVEFSSDGTLDYDEDEYSLSWDFGDGNTSNKDTKHIFTKEGIYEATLTVTDSKGNKTSESIEIWAGNSPPEIDLKISGNQTFFWDGVPFDYDVEVNDEEDGNVTYSQNQSLNKPWVSIDILEEGFDETQIILGHRAPLKTLEGKRLIDGSDCLACHKGKEKSIGPDYVSVANKYEDDPAAIKYLTGKIISGGGGVWGDQAMAAHPQLEISDVEKMVDYILSLSADDLEGIPLAGNYTPELKNMQRSSKLIIRASYEDKGSGSIPSILIEEQKVLKSPILTGNSIFNGEEYEPMEFEGNSFTLINEGGWFSFDQIDLNGIKEIEINVTIEEESKTKISIFENSLEGDLIGSNQFFELTATGPREGSRFARATIPINSKFMGNIVFSIESDADKEIIAAFTHMEFKR
jgi:cytochrome c